MSVRTRRGEVLETTHNAAMPASDLAAQGARLREKFVRLTTPLLHAGQG